MKSEDELKLGKLRTKAYLPTCDIHRLHGGIHRNEEDDRRNESPECIVANDKNCSILSSRQGLDFGTAFKIIKNCGKGMRLPHWKPDVIIRVQFPDEHSKMTAPYLYVESRFGRVPWKETMIEMFEENWEIVD